MNTNRDIRKVNKSLDEADSGFLLSFPPPPSGSIKYYDIYKYEFDVVYKLPTEPVSIIEFTPSVANNPSKASYISSSITSNINIGISIKSIHKAETQTLTRLQIKDIYNNLLYTDYILVICSPQKTVRIDGQIISRFGSGSIGPNGGRILRLNTNNNAALSSQLFKRMQVIGPGIPTEQIIVINSFIQDSDVIDIELLPYFDINDTVPPGGTYTFSIVNSCLSSEDLTQIRFNNKYILLDKNNNWSFSYKEKTILKFVPNSSIGSNDSISILLSVKNFDALIGEDLPSSIPSIGYLYTLGAVARGSVCINSI